ncbi:hypothetical protein [Acinetobacter boissieri]|uniref:Uncharacterized protein n=1 Tax=Acinetobacter boissieri TaxID=1219383 RepID=A0A1G6GYD5_9GAMM|nr:hypothetical protein [Acinetobacter boissieri]SDB87057.1 hypothetical protein SAMN05421733_10334 [Acinetobacter boissieri]
MITFNPITIHDQHYQMHEISFNDALKVSVIPQIQNERRLSEFLRATLKGTVDPLKMTVQERYFLLLKYLETQSDTLLGVDVDFSKFLGDSANFKTCFKHEDVSLRLITGLEAEYLEAKCKSVAEWIACCMAIQLSYVEHDVLKGFLDPVASSFEEGFMKRLNYLKDLPLSEFEAYFDDFKMLSEDTGLMIDIGLDSDGFTVRGTDDAPMRFCTSSCFFGLFKDLDQYSH